MRRLRGPYHRHGQRPPWLRNHHARSICTNNRTALRDKLQGQVLNGLKQRLLAPELVEQFVKTYMQEVNAATERGTRRANLHSEQARIHCQIKTVMDTIKDSAAAEA